MGSHTSLALSVVAISMFTLTFVSPTQGEETGWKAKWERIVEAAKKEGQVNTYGLADTTHPAVLNAFNKRYPEIKVVTVFGRSGLLHRVVAERRARKYLSQERKRKSR